MKKNKKGFALMEILAVAVVVSGIFIVVYSNFFPLRAELETRTLYNNTQATYAAFYMRKALANENLSDMLGSNKYIKLDTTTIDTYTNISGENRHYFKKLYEQLEIEELILTNSNITDLKTNYGSDGKLYKYITYLPKYNKTVSENYRIILKLKDGTYATTEVKFTSCFLFNENSLSGYSCPGTDVVIPTVNNGTNITNIAAGVFENKSIGSVTLSKNLTTIGSNAFKTNSIERLVIPSNITSIGAGAFANSNALMEIGNTSVIVNLSHNSFDWCNIFGITGQSDETNDCTIIDGDIKNDQGEVILRVLSEIPDEFNESNE